MSEIEEATLWQKRIFSDSKRARLIKLQAWGQYAQDRTKVSNVSTVTTSQQCHG